VKTKGGYAVGDVAVMLDHEWSRLSLDASAASSFRYYPDYTDLNGGAHQAQAGLDFELRPRTHLMLSTHASYAPFYSFQVFPVLPDLPGVEPPPQTDLDFAVIRGDAVGYGAVASISHDIGRRSEVTGSFGRRASKFSGSRDRDLVDTTLGAEFSSGFSRNTNLQVRYSRQDATYGGSLGRPGASVNGVDVSVDYARRHSPTRRTGFELGSGAARIDQFGADYYRITAIGAVNHEMGRTWRARVQYRRGLSLIDGFPEPLYADSVTASVSGLFSPRVEYDGSAGYSEGEAGLTLTSPRYDALTATSRLRVAITRVLAVHGEYLFYDYRIRPGATPLPPGFPEGLTRHSARIGLTLWLSFWR
jgi:hypothetical protein